MNHVKLMSKVTPQEKSVKDNVEAKPNKSRIQTVGWHHKYAGASKLRWPFFQIKTS